VNLSNFQIEMAQGTIKRLTDRGFGFIAQQDSDKDLFFHSSELQGVDFNDLKEGDAVTFEVGEGPKGPNATKVEKV
jgi:cold shock protein